MCKKKQFKYCPSEIDECMKEEINKMDIGFIKTLACCCGHSKYPKTIVIEHKLTGKPFEIFSAKFIPRKKKFYKKDKQGYYYIPEVLENEK